MNEKFIDFGNGQYAPPAVLLDGQGGVLTPGKMTAAAFASGALANGVPLVVSMASAPLPATVTLKSAAAGRLIELSTDGGVEYFTPAVDQSSATMQIVTVLSTISHIRLTGAAADIWSVR